MKTGEDDDNICMHGYHVTFHMWQISKVLPTDEHCLDLHTGSKASSDSMLKSCQMQFKDNR